VKSDGKGAQTKTPPGASAKSSNSQRNGPSLNPVGGADSADSVSGTPSGDPPRIRPQRSSRIPLVPAEGPPEKVWDEYFAKNTPDPLAVLDVVKQLTKQKQTEAAVACISAALVHGQAQPWMYQVLALELEQAGRPRDEIERALLSNIDFSAVNMTNVLYSAATLTRFGLKERALAMYRQASAVDPTRLEPYALGLKLAREANDADAVAWAASGILQRAWGAGYEALHSDALAAAHDLEAALRTGGDNAAADRLARTIAEARQCDLVIELSWSGRADLDLLVEEPSGAICSAENPVTTGGGIFTHDGFGGDQKDTHDNYVCPRGMSGDYRVTVRHVSGDVVGKRAVLKITRYQGSPREIVDFFTTEISDQDKIVRVTLTNGRLKELTALPLLDVPRNQPLADRRNRRERLVRPSAASLRAEAEFHDGRRRAGGGPAAPGYQPVITVLADGVTNTAMAVISGDRRYVRLTTTPAFSTISGVDTFSFFSSGGSTNTGGGRPGGATGTGR
jgi:hypothetical protein